MESIVFKLLQTQDTTKTVHGNEKWRFRIKYTIRTLCLIWFVCFIQSTLTLGYDMIFSQRFNFFAEMDNDRQNFILPWVNYRNRYLIYFSFPGIVGKIWKNGKTDYVTECISKYHMQNVAFLSRCIFAKLVFIMSYIFSIYVTIHHLLLNLCAFYA